MLSTRAHSFDARAQSLTLVAERWPGHGHAIRRDTGRLNDVGA